MATSGSSNFTMTGGEIVQLAFSMVGVGREGEALAAEEAAEGLKRLNLMIKTWSAEGIRLWKKKNAILFTTTAQAAYSLGISGDRSATTWAETTLGAAAAASATALTVASITGISNADVLGILLDSGAMHWTTVSGAPSGTTVTAASGLASAAASGNRVFAYTSIMGRPLRILDTQRRDSSGRDIPMYRFSREAYRDLPTKTSAGTPTQFYYDPQINTGLFSIWPVPSDATNTIRFTADMLMEDFDLSTDNPDAPVEWIEAFATNLAVRLIPTYGDVMKSEDKQIMMAQAASLKETLMGFDMDPASVSFEPEPTWGGR